MSGATPIRTLTATSPRAYVEVVMYVPKLPDESKRVLRVIMSRGVASGNDLQFATQMKPEALVTALEPLIQMGIIGASGFPSEADGVLDSFFNLRPSARSIAESLVNLS
jgi:hypothetical protein